MNNPLTSFELWAGLFGGLALFLFGMDIMTRALKQAAGDYMRDILAKLTKNRYAGVGIGAFVTAIIQSSSVTTVILVGFISAGLLSMSQSVAVIMGANIGTTITAQILAFKVTKLALPVIAIGFLVSLTAKRETWRQYGLMLLGLGLVFYGMSIMSDAMKPLRTFQPFIDFMISMNHPLLAALVGALFTAVIQSSSATTGIVIVMAGQGLIGLEGAIALALGANIGTCVTAGLAAIGKPREAVRAAVVHTLFNTAGVLLWIAFIPQLADFARWISPAREHLEGMARVAVEAPRQIANAHTLFNIINTFVFIGFTTQIARLVEWMIPDVPIDKEKMLMPKYLDETLLATPAIALENTRREIGRLGERVAELVNEVMPVTVSGTREELTLLAAKDKPIDELHRAIIEYLGKISITNLSTIQSQRLMVLIQIANDLERVGDRVATDMVTSARKRLDENVKISPATKKVLKRYHGEVVKALDDALKAVASEDNVLAGEVRAMKAGLASMTKDVYRHELERLTADAPNRLATYSREMEIIEILDSVFKVARRIARTQLKQTSDADLNIDPELKVQSKL